METWIDANGVLVCVECSRRFNIHGQVIIVENGDVCEECGKEYETSEADKYDEILNAILDDIDWSAKNPNG